MQQEQPSIRKRFRFLDLPVDIRNLVYDELLTPSCGAAMDFTSCTDCMHTFSLGFDEEDHEPTARAWYSGRWREMRGNLLNLALASRQVRDETSKVFWSQDLRFTGDFGWTMFYHFLELIGPCNWPRLKNVTVCHPGFSMRPGQVLHCFTHNTASDGSYTPGKICLCLEDAFDLHLRAFSFKRPDDKAFQKGVLRDPEAPEWYYGPWSENGVFWGQPLCDVLGGLNQITLTLPQFQNPSEQASFHEVGSHPIHKMEWGRQRNVSRRVFYLVSAWDVSAVKDQLTFDHIYRQADPKEELAAAIKSSFAHQDEYPEAVSYDQYIQKRRDDEDFSMHITKANEEIPIPMWRTHPPERYEDIRLFIETIEQLGWKVTQIMHDLHCQYPVEDGKACVNKGLCKFVKSLPTRDRRYYECQGGNPEHEMSFRNGGLSSGGTGDV